MHVSFLLICLNNWALTQWGLINYYMIENYSLCFTHFLICSPSLMKIMSQSVYISNKSQHKVVIYGFPDICLWFDRGLIMNLIRSRFISMISQVVHLTVLVKLNLDDIKMLPFWCQLPLVSSAWELSQALVGTCYIKMWLPCLARYGCLTGKSL